MDVVKCNRYEEFITSSVNTGVNKPNKKCLFVDNDVITLQNCSCADIIVDVSDMNISDKMKLKNRLGYLIRFPVLMEVRNGDYYKINIPEN